MHYTKRMTRCTSIPAHNHTHSIPLSPSDFNRYHGFVYQAHPPLTRYPLSDFNMMHFALQSLNDILSQLAKSAGAAERVLSLLDLHPDIDANTGSDAEVAVAQWGVRFDEVGFHYQMRPREHVLRSLSFEVEEGGVCALVGRSGGGKTTIIHLLLRFYDPVTGRILLGGRDLRDLSLASVHRCVGVVSQETELFNGTLIDNIGYGAPPFSEAELYKAAMAAGAHSFISSLEDGYSTRVGERGLRLSGGQRQRIAIARCLLRSPRLLLLDEATSSLDTESEAQVQRALDGLIWQRQGGLEEGGRQGEGGGSRSRSSTVILVAHRLSTVRNADQILVIQQGEAVERGTHRTLLERGGVYASLVETQLEKEVTEEVT